MADLREKLRAAWVASGMSLDELGRAAALDCSGESLSRKLSGNQAMKLDEACALARALKGSLVLKLPPKRAA